MAFRFSNIPAAIRSLIGRGTPGGGVWVPSYDSGAGVSVSAEQAMRLAAVHACVRVLSEDIASLPLNVYRRLKNEKGKERATDHPLFDLVHNRPNPEMVAYTFIEALMVNLLLQGNAYAFIEYNRAGQIIGLWPIMAYGVVPFRDEHTNQIKYHIGGKDYDSSEILHIPGLSYDGLVGMTPIGYARETLGLAAAAEQYGSKYFKNGTHLGGVISLQGELSEGAYNRMKDSFSKLYKGLLNAHGVPVMEGGATFTPLGVKPEEAQFLETRKYQRAEIAGIFRVPPHMIADLERATFSNIEHQDSAYLQRSLLPWLTRFSQGFTAALLMPNERKRLFVEHDTGNFLKGDTLSRMKAYAAAIQGGFMTPNEARAKENWNPMVGGDDLRLPLNTEPGSQVGKTDPAPKAPDKNEPDDGDPKK